MLRTGRGFVGRVAQFALPVAAGALAPLVCIITISRVAGAHAFLALGLGQALGGMAAIAGTWGWDVNGPQRLRLQDESGRAALLRDSLFTRGTVLAVAALIAASAAYALTPPGTKLLAALTAVAASTQALSPSWWLAGTGQPGTIMRFDALPRAGAAIAAVPVVIATSQAVAYPCLTIAVVAGAYAVFYSRELTGRTRTQPRPHILQSLRSNLPAATIAMLAVAYTTAALPLVQVVAPLSATYYAAGARLLNYWNLSTITTTNALFGLVDDGTTPESRARRHRACWLLTGQSLALGLIFAVAAPTLSERLFAIPFESRTMALLAAASFTLAGVNTAVTKLVLIPEGAQRLVVILVLASALVSTALVPALAVSGGATGAFAAVCVGELLVAVPAIVMVLRSAAPAALDVRSIRGGTR